MFMFRNIWVFQTVRVQSGPYGYIPGPTVRVRSGTSVEYKQIRYCLYADQIPLILESGHEKMCLIPYANNKGQHLCCSMPS